MFKCGKYTSLSGKSLNNHKKQKNKRVKTEKCTALSFIIVAMTTPADSPNMQNFTDSRLYSHDTGNRFRYVGAASAHASLN